MGYFEELEELRREAYVRAVVRASETHDVVGYIGSGIPVGLFHALGLMAIPVHGVDGDILRFSEEQGLCSVIDSTLTYAKTERCPLIHSCRLIVVDDGCPLMAEKLSELREKDVYVYRLNEPGNIQGLRDKLENVYSRRFDEKMSDAAAVKMKEISALLSRLRDHSGLSGSQVYILEYYLKFLPLGERLDILREVSENVGSSDEPVEFLPIRVQSGAGIYRQIDRLMKGRPYRIIEAGCGGERTSYDFVYQSCPFAEGEKICYEQS